MYSKSKLKTLLRLAGFKPQKHYNWRNVMQSGHFQKGNRYYRFRCTLEGKYVYDMSCKKEDFDRWANSQKIHSGDVQGLLLYLNQNKETV
jgi:hypothetical protein